MNYRSTSNNITYNNHPVNTGVNGKYFCYDIILQKTLERMIDMTNRFSKVLFVRFDVRLPRHYQHDGKNNELVHLLKIMRENGVCRGFDYHYIWCRERKSSDNPHYHVVLLLNGHKVQAYKAFLFEVVRAWSLVLGQDASGLIDWCDKDRSGNPVENGIMIRRPIGTATGEELATQQLQFTQDFDRCFEWASYLAKVNQKESDLMGVRRFGCSQLGSVS